MHIQKAIQSHFAERATLDEVAALEAWFREDSANVRIFAELGVLEWHLLCEHVKLDAAAVSSAIREAEEDREPVLELVALGSRRSKPVRPAGRSLTFRNACEVAGFIAVQGLRSKVGKNLSIAAAAAIGVLLYFAIFGGGGTPQTQVAVTHRPSEPVEVRAQSVATLTAQHDARWASTMLSTGDELVAGETLTLTHGFAEVTTRRGAIVILQAPCTVELIDNDNALRLHAGKLVGVCEPESSKGFLVRTPHMDVVDLGTRFGINATHSAATDVHVFEGEVEVAMVVDYNRPPIQERLVAGHAARAMATAGGLVAIDDDRSSFAGLMAFADTILPRGATEAGIAALSGDVVWSPGSAYLGVAWTQWQKDDRAHVFEELGVYRLPADAPVTLLGPGSTQGIGQTLPARSIPRGTTVRTYLVVLFPGVPGQTAAPRGSITFEGEVLGIATHMDQDRVFNDLVGDPTRLVPIQNVAGNWIETNQGSNNQDVVALEDDGRTVTFSFNGGGVATDAVRVFVLVPED